MAELDLAIGASVDAGNSIMGVYRKKFETRMKSDDTPVTEADLKSNEVIRRALSATPYMILSEEDRDDEARLGEEAVWIVDPLDGTLDFIDRIGEFTVMIALVRNKKPVLGVINWPAGKTVYAAQLGGGAFMHSDGRWQKLAVTGTSELAACRAVGSRHRHSEMEKALIKKLGIGKFTHVGSSLKVGKISSGEAEVYMATTEKMKEWDSAASYCIIGEAGGRMTDMRGNELTYNNRDVYHRHGILATNGPVHDRIVREFSGA